MEPFNVAPVALIEVAAVVVAVGAVGVMVIFSVSIEPSLEV
jgi:hypothetical protein